MIYTEKIKKAIKFAIKTHEVYQKQKRKGKDIAYITHPLTVGIILASAGVKEDVIVAGILHDTIEDSIEEKKVTKEMVAERFGNDVAQIVLSVTEQNKELSWEARKGEALSHIENFNQDSLLLKSADILSNTNELVEDYNKNGEQIFDRFNAPKDKILKHYLEAISVILKRWKENPLGGDLESVSEKLQMIGAKEFMIKDPAKIIEFKQYNDDINLRCPVCKWEGTVKESGCVEYYDQLLDVSCPICDKTLLVVNYPSAG